MVKEKKSFFERLTGTVKLDDEDENGELSSHTVVSAGSKFKKAGQIKGSGSSGSSSMSHSSSHASSMSHGSHSGGEENWMDEENADAELTVDVYQTPDTIIIKAMTAGVDPNDLDVAIARDMVIIRGHREEEKTARTEDYFIQELYWGSFSRTITLPEEIDVDEAEAVGKHGLLILKLPKLDKKRQTKLKVKTI